MFLDPKRLASLFDAKKVGYFSTKLFNQLGDKSYGWVKDSPLHTEMNFSLKRWNRDSFYKDLSANLVIIGIENILIILDENYRYRCRAIMDEANFFYNGSLKVHGIYLSESGEASVDPRYLSMKYRNLTEELDKLMDLRKGTRE